uniref:Uncharacterized protein n=1 Tax=Cacopsylla melanoneura TaxID=428564 RepID=A0A8D9BKN5_9HEMI
MRLGGRARNVRILPLKSFKKIEWKKSYTLGLHIISPIQQSVQIDTFFSNGNKHLQEVEKKEERTLDQGLGGGAGNEDKAERVNVLSNKGYDALEKGIRTRCSRQFSRGKKMKIEIKLCVRECDVEANVAF